MSDWNPANWGNPRNRDTDILESVDYFPGPVAYDKAGSRVRQPIAHTQYSPLPLVLFMFI